MKAPSRLILRSMAICLLLIGCASEPVRRKDLLDFLQDGITRRADVQMKLGEPNARYESSRILAYRLRKDEAGYAVMTQARDWNGVQYSLILAFGPDGVLARHSLVDVHKP